MGCLGGIMEKLEAGGRLKTRVKKNTLKISGYPAGLFNIEKFNLLCVITFEKIAFIDYTTNETKFEQETEIVHFENSFNFSEKDNTLEIKGNMKIRFVYQNLR